MAWVSPKTWATSEIVTAAMLNTHVRDNLLETSPAKAAAAGDIFYATAANAISRLAKGTARKQLAINSGETAPEWVDSMQSLMTAQGDVVYASAANTPVKLAKGTAGQTLEMNAGETAPQWGNTDLTRSKGFFIDKEYYYPHTIIPFSDCESADGWANNSWDGVAGTVANDTTNFKTGSQGISITVAVNNGAGHLVYAKNLALFPDGSASATTDYVRLWIYITTAEINKMAADSNLTLVFFCDTYPTATNYFYYQVQKASLVNGGEFYNIAKSAFSNIGSPNWANVKGVHIAYNSPGSTAPTSAMTWTIDTIHVCRKNPSSSAPNPFIRKINNVETAEFAINSGFWWLGLESGVLNLRDLNPISAGNTTVISPLVGTLSYTNNCIITQTLTCKTNQNCYGVAWSVSTGNMIRGIIDTDVLYLQSIESGAVATQSTTALTCVSGDKFYFELEIRESTVTLLVFKNGDFNTPYELSVETALTGSGYLANTSKLSYYTNLESLSITTAEHTHHADVAEVAKSLTPDYTKYPDYGGTTTNTGNAYVLAAPVIAALATGMAVSFKCNADATGAVTLNWSGMGAKSIKKGVGSDVTNLKQDSIYTVRYNGTNFMLQGSDSAGDATADDVLASKTFSNDTDTGLTGTLALTGDAAVATVLLNRTFYKDDAKTKLTGTMPNNSGDVAAVTYHVDGTSLHVIPAQGYTNGSSNASVITDTDFVAGNIVTGADVFGLAGSYSNIASIQRGTATINATPFNVAISAVDTAKSIVRFTQVIPSQNAATACIQAKITSSTNVQLTVNTYSVNLTVYWEVIEFNGISSFQQGDTTLGAATSTTATITSVNVNKTLIFASWYTDSADGAYAFFVGIVLTNATTITFNKYSATDNHYIHWQVIEFN